MEFINFLILLLIIFIINHIFKSKNFLLSNTGLKHQSYTHAGKVPLSGGLIILIFFQIYIDQNNILKFFIFLFFLIGLIGDLNLFKKVILRLLLQIFLIVLSIIYLKILIVDLRVEFLNTVLTNFYFNIFLTSFCFLVLINGSNFIDGSNGLSLGYYMIIYLILFSLTNEQFLDYNKDIFLSIIICFLILFIFNLFNKLYLGDNGIYIISFFTGFILIEVTNLNTDISPYFVMNLLWYPAFETLFSIIRKIKSNFSPMNPDTNHLHQLLFFLLKKKTNFTEIVNNSLVGIIVNIYNMIFLFVSSLNIMDTKYQLYLVIMNIFNYLIIYKLLIKFKKKHYLSKIDE